MAKGKMPSSRIQPLGNRSFRCPNPGKADNDNRRETKVLTGHDPSRW